MSIRKSLLLMLFISSISCSAISPLPTPTIIPTPTPINLSNLKLDSLLIQYGDLPAGYDGAQISNNAIPKFLGSNVPIPQYQIHQEFEKNGELQGGIWLGLYEDVLNVTILYQRYISGLIKENLAEYITKNGTKITASSMSINFNSTFIPNFKFKTVALTFYKCNYVGYLTISETDEVRGMVNYVERLAARLDEILDCK